MFLLKERLVCLLGLEAGEQDKTTCLAAGVYIPPGEPPLGLAASPYHHEKGDVPSGFQCFKLVQESSATAIRGP